MTRDIEYVYSEILAVKKLAILLKIRLLKHIGVLIIIIMSRATDNGVQKSIMKSSRGS